MIVSNEQRIAIRKVMADNRLRQYALASAWGITQGHLSKVLAGKVPASPHLQEQIRALLRGESERDATVLRVYAIAERIASRSDLHASGIMHILQGIELMIDAEAG